MYKITFEGGKPEPTRRADRRADREDFRKGGLSPLSLRVLHLSAQAVYRFSIQSLTRFPESLPLVNCKSLRTHVGAFRSGLGYHASLAPEEYRTLLKSAGFRVVAHTVEDPNCGGHTIWLAQAEH
jgi:hypothetical protein